jgi:hypothetical protein
MKLRRRAPLPLPVDPECHQVGAVLQAYLDGELGADDADAVSAHLAYCRQCGIERRTIEQVIAAIRRQRPDLDAEALRRLAGFVDELSGNGHPPTGETG